MITTQLMPLALPVPMYSIKRHGRMVFGIDINDFDMFSGLELLRYMYQRQYRVQFRTYDRQHANADEQRLR